MVSVMKLEKAPTETYADVGGLEQQIQEIKEAVELPLTHPEYFLNFFLILTLRINLKVLRRNWNQASKRSYSLRPAWHRQNVAS